jgi:hypothetical protein
MYRYLLPIAAVVAAVLVGCSKAPDVTIPATAAGHDDHQLTAAHGGVIAEIGDDLYHAEAVFEADGTVRLYLLGKDAKTVIEIDAKTVEAFATPDGSPSAVKFEFAPAPQSGDTPGKTSLLVGKLPDAAVGKSVAVSIPARRVGADRFRVGFHSPEGHDAMPAKRTDDAAQKVFGTSGGIYTDADIKANGTKTPEEKYKGIRAKHDTEPKPGDKLCPISETLANPQFTWVVGGKTYEFCCVPCVEEFVSAAKEKPDSIKPPDAYRKK